MGAFHGVGEKLGFKAQAGAFAEGSALFAVQRIAVQEIPAVELHAGQVGVGVHDPARGFVDQLGRQAKALAVDDPVVVVAAGPEKLGIILLDPLPDGVEIGEIHGRALDGEDFTGGQAFRIGGGEKGSMQLELMLKDGAAFEAAQIEVGVVGEVADGVRVGDGGVVDGEPVVVGQAVDYGDLQVPGITLIPIRAEIGQGQGAVPDLILPDDLVVAQKAAVKLVFALVGVQGIGFSAQFKAGLGQAVGVPPDEGAQIPAHFFVGFYGGVAQHHVLRPSVAVGHPQGLEGAAVCKNAGLCAGRIGQSQLINLLAGGGAAEKSFCDDCHCEHSFPNKICFLG